VLQALLTPALAIPTGMIAFFQWRTAHQRVVIDLFDRRMKIYIGCRDVLRKIVISPNATTDQDGHEFKMASADAEFLFGDDLVEHFKKVENAIFDLSTYETTLKDAPVGQECKDLVAKRRIAIDTVERFYKEELRSLLKPYIQLKQTLRW